MKLNKWYLRYHLRRRLASNIPPGNTMKHCCLSLSPGMSEANSLSKVSRRMVSLFQTVDIQVILFLLLSLIVLFYWVQWTTKSDLWIYLKLFNCIKYINRKVVILFYLPVHRIVKVLLIWRCPEHVLGSFQKLYLDKRVKWAISLFSDSDKRVWFVCTPIATKRFDRF